MLKTLSIYIHYPFCEFKCPYCDFNSHVSNSIDYQAYLNAYCQELDFFFKKIGNRKITTIFFGGGTPSLMPEIMIEKILAKINQLWQFDENCEITLEANPSSMEAKKFSQFSKLGINRLSLGIQALNQEDLNFLQRKHSLTQALDAIELAKKNFDNFSFDLIYARPNQDLNSWQKELNLALSFQSKHLSLYQLTIEKGTKFFSDFHQKKFILPNEDLASEFYNLTNDILIQNNFDHYEVSNYAKQIKSIANDQKNNQNFHVDYRSKHNLAYWQSDEYIGIGAGAHSRINFLDQTNRFAIMMIHQPSAWLKKVNESQAGIQKLESISNQQLIEEILLMGLRINMGIEIQKLEKLINLNFSQIFDQQKLTKLITQDLIKITDNRILIENKNWLLLNSIIFKLINCLKCQDQ
jgi:putative oxygen-independent coproporphyrinogen III oxidase